MYTDQLDDDIERLEEHLDIYTYENGWRHVECDKCFALGPGEGSKRDAAARWNKRALEAALVQVAPHPLPQEIWASAGGQ